MRNVVPKRGTLLSHRLQVCHRAVGIGSVTSRTIVDDPHPVLGRPLELAGLAGCSPSGNERHTRVDQRQLGFSTIRA